MGFVEIFVNLLFGWEVFLGELVFGWGFFRFFRYMGIFFGYVFSWGLGCFGWVGVGEVY